MRTLPVLFALTVLAASHLPAQVFQASQAYTNADLGFGLRYPAAFNREPTTAVSRFEGAVFALHPEADPAHTGADPCAPVLLTLGANLDRPAEPAKKGQPAVIPAKGTLTLTEVSRTCVEKTVLDDAILSQAVGSATGAEGMRPLGKMRNDLVAGSTVWWAAAAGYNKDAKGKRTAEAGTSIIGSAAAVVHGTHSGLVDHGQRPGTLQPPYRSFAFGRRLKLQPAAALPAQRAADHAGRVTLSLRRVHGQARSRPAQFFLLLKRSSKLLSSTYRTGIKSRLSTVESTMPPTTAVPTEWRPRAPAPVAK